MKKVLADKLDVYLRSFLVLWGVTLVICFLVAVSSLVTHRSVSETALSLVDSLDLTVLSLVPSGQVLRHPGIVHPGVDMRMMPSLPSVLVESSSLLLQVEEKR